MPAHGEDHRQRGRGWVLIALGLLAGGGCSHLHNPPGPPQWSTIGTDRSTIPRGQTIPPAGFGVDLVDASRAGRSRPNAEPAPPPTRDQDGSVSVAGF